DGPRKPRAHHSRAQRLDKIVERLDAPVRVLARKPRINESRFELGEVYAGVGNADDERRRAALHDQPVGVLAHHRGPRSRAGKIASPIASITAPLRTRLVAAAMSGWK